MDFNFPSDITRVEIYPEDWMGKGGYWRNELDKLASQYTLVAHGKSLSMGSRDMINKVHIKEIKAFLDDYNIAQFTEYLCFTQDNYSKVYSPIPLSYNNETLKIVSSNIKKIQDYLERPLLIENIASCYNIENTYNEVDYIKSLLALDKVFLSLNVHHLLKNNDGHIETLPAEKIKAVHISTKSENKLELVLNTLNNILKQTSTPLIILENDVDKSDNEWLTYQITLIKKVLTS